MLLAQSSQEEVDVFKESKDIKCNVPHKKWDDGGARNKLLVADSMSSSCQTITVTPSEPSVSSITPSRGGEVKEEIIFSLHLYIQTF